MPALTSSVTLIGNWSETMKENGFHIFSHWSQAQSFLQKESLQVLGLNLTTLLEKNFQKTLMALREKFPTLTLILVAPEGMPSKELAQLRRNFPISFILEKYDDPNILSFIHKALEISRWKGHFHELEKMRLSHTQRLEALKNELHDRVEKRKKTLIDSKAKVLEQNQWAQSLGQIVTGAVASDSVHELETAIKQVLIPLFNIQDLMLKDITWKPEPTDTRHFRIEELKDTNGTTAANLYFISDEKKKWTSKEKIFIGELAEYISLAFLRLRREERIKELEEEWTRTFQAIQHPLLLMDMEFNILQSNAANMPANGKCYTQLFGRAEPCVGCARGKNFSILNNGKQINVRSQALRDLKNTDGFLHVYEDVTEKLKLEQGIIQSAPLAELGTVASGIAHELNNPLAGIISFIQLIKADLPKEDEYYEDLLEMEKAALRSKTIIQDLLSFVRTK
ncbi:MAG: histidine kinase dimerization/phospho-acceptor domain-containing protein [Bdellovibrionota bacterium]